MYLLPFIRIVMIVAVKLSAYRILDTSRANHYRFRKEVL